MLFIDCKVYKSTTKNNIGYALKYYKTVKMGFKLLIQNKYKMYKMFHMHWCNFTTLSINTKLIW